MKKRYKNGVEIKPSEFLKSQKVAKSAKIAAKPAVKFSVNDSI